MPTAPAVITIYESAFEIGLTSVSMNPDNPMLIKGDNCLYGGRYIKLKKGAVRPEQVIRTEMLLPGDIIVGRKTLDDTSLFVYLVLDNGNLLQMTENGCEIIGGDTTAAVLDSLLAMHSFVVLRPSLNMK